MPYNRRNPTGPMNACERGIWIDTEGHISRKRIVVSQREEREVIEDYCAGARMDGVHCRVRYDKVNRIYLAEIEGLENMAKEIALTQNCIRTKRRRKQIERFKEQLAKPRRYAPYPPTIRARKILGL